MAITSDASGLFGPKPKSYSPFVNKTSSSSSPIFSKTSVPASSGVAPVANSAPAPRTTSGGGGGGYSAPSMMTPMVAPAPPPRRPLSAIIDEDFALRQQRDENARLEEEYGAETGRLRGETEREQGLRREELATDLEDMTLDSSESLAARGLLNSGGFFLNQDRIDAEGGRRESSIADMLTNLLSSRGSGLMALQAQGRNALNERIANITRDYGAGIGGY